MQKFDICYEDIISPSSLWNAWFSYRKGKRSRTVIIAFERHLENNLIQLREELNNGTYKHGGYYQFFVNDPKQRCISAPSVRDHIVHQAIYNKLYYFFDVRFLPCSFSCRRGKGTHKAVAALAACVRRVSANYRKPCWVMHGDIKRCFDSVDHEILYALLRWRVHCVRTLQLLKKIIESYTAASFVSQRPHGIPLGNLTSQLFVNVYLHELDCFVKQKLRVKHYLRYADDFLAVFSTRDECKRFVDTTRTFVMTELKLDFPRSHEYITELSGGIDVLGMRFLPWYQKVRPRTFQRCCLLFKQRLNTYKNDEISADTLNASWQSFCGMLRYGHSMKQIRELRQLVNIYV